VAELTHQLCVAQVRFQSVCRSTPRPTAPGPTVETAASDPPTPCIFTPVPAGGPSTSFAPRYQLPVGGNAFGNPSAPAPDDPPVPAGGPSTSFASQYQLPLGGNEFGVPCFSIKAAGLPTFDGAKQDLETAQLFVKNLERYFAARARVLGCVIPEGRPSTTGWATAAILQLRGPALR
jgi:hypothetical protein